MARSRDSGSSSADRADGLGTGAPVGATLPVLALPDGDRLLQGVDAVPRGLERLGPVRGRHHHRHRAVGQLEVTDAVQERDSVDHRPLAARLDGYRGELHDPLFLVGLVGEAGHAAASVGVVAHHTEEDHDRPTGCGGGPRGGGVDRQGDADDFDPVAGRGRVHARHRSDEGVAGAPRRGGPELLARTKPQVRGDEEPRGHVGTLRAMSAEDSGGDDAPEPDDALSGPPPDPLDRPWVHPSELHSFVSTPTAPPREPRPREWAIGVGSAVAAVLGTILVLVAFGALGGRHRPPNPPRVVTNPGDVVDYAVAERVGTAVAASVVMVRARSGESSRPVGSGVVVTSDQVITAAHNLNGVGDVVVVTTSGRQLDAKVVGTDAVTDLAVLSVADGDLQLARLGGSGPPRIGQTVVAVGVGASGHDRVSIDVVSDHDVMVDAGTG